MQQARKDFKFFIFYYVDLLCDFDKGVNINMSYLVSESDRLQDGLAGVWFNGWKGGGGESV